MQIPFLIPGDIETQTGGYAYARALIAHGELLGLTLQPVQLPGDFPFPSETSVAETGAILAALASDRPALVDGLAFGALPEEAVARSAAQLVVLLHHPLGYETGLDDSTAAGLIAREKAALAHACAVVVPSEHVAGVLREAFDVPGNRITVAPPGTQVIQPSLRSGNPPVILTAATITPRKGHDVLVTALAELTELPWVARFIGSTDRDTETTARLRAQIADCGLDHRIELTGSVPETMKRAYYHAADFFVLASHYEGFGMVFAEAMVAGLPIVATTGGAVPELVPAEAGILVPPGDISGLRDAIAIVLTDRDRADAMASAARAAGRQLPRWDTTTATLKSVLDACTP